MKFPFLVSIFMFATLCFDSNAEKHSLYKFNNINPNILKLKAKKLTEKNKRITAAVLAFPVPFGLFGAHRIYLGSKPIVPVTYIATIGGCIGVLPLIDFFVILSHKDLKDYENNHNIFMWNKSQKAKSNR